MGNADALHLILKEYLFQAGVPGDLLQDLVGLKDDVWGAQISSHSDLCTAAPCFV